MVPGTEVLRAECTKAGQRPLGKVAVIKTELYYSMSCGARKPVSRETILTTKMWQRQSKEGEVMQGDRTQGGLGAGPRPSRVVLADV